MLIFAGALYLRLLKIAQNQTGQAFPLTSVLIFGSGLGVIYASLASPIDRIGEEYLFSMHMVQHNIFIYLVPWQILRGIPEWMATYWFEQMGGFWQKLYRLLAYPILAGLIFNLLFTLWHIPFLYDWALRDRMIHNLEHATMLLTAIFAWIPLWGPLRAQRPSHPVQMMYLLGLAIAQLPVFAYVTFSKTVLYPTYALAPRLTSFSALEDQQVGGVIMKIVAMLVLFIAFTGVFIEWYKAERARDEAEEEVRFGHPPPAAMQS